MGATVTTTEEETAIASLPHDVGVLGRYVLLETIGHGGMGVVWKSYDPMLDRNVALKLMVSSSEVGGAVVAEAQAMAKVQHPNVVTVYDAGVHQAGERQLAYIAMELVAGRTMKDWLDEPLLRRSLEIRRKKGRPGDLDIGNTAGILGRNLLVQNKKEALPLLEEALSTLEHHRDAGHAETAEARFWVARARVELAIRSDGALALAIAACNELDDADMKSEPAECHAWLAKHPDDRH